MPRAGNPPDAVRDGGTTPRTSWKWWQARPSCLRLFVHLVRAAASRTFCTAGRSRPMRMAMMAITTNSSISVNPADRFGGWRDITHSESDWGEGHPGTNPGAEQSAIAAAALRQPERGQLGRPLRDFGPQPGR